MTAREVALMTLSAWERQGAWSEGYMKKAVRDAALDKRDAALAVRLCFGILQNKLLLDYYIGQFSAVKTDKMEIHVRNALRLGIYQMAFLTRIPHSAAVNESVELARRHCKNPRAPGMVNAILRNVSRNIESCPSSTSVILSDTLPCGTATPHGWCASSRRGWAGRKPRLCFPPTTVKCPRLHRSIS